MAADKIAPSAVDAVECAYLARLIQPAFPGNAAAPVLDVLAAWPGVSLQTQIWAAEAFLQQTLELAVGNPAEYTVEATENLPDASCFVVALRRWMEFSDVEWLKLAIRLANGERAARDVIIKNLWSKNLE